MFKIFMVIIILCFLSALPSDADRLTAGISYTVDIARIQSFRDVDSKIDMQRYRPFFIDKNKDKNLKALRHNKHKFRDRILTTFEDRGYGVYYPKLKTGFYYSNNGDLIAVSKTLGNDYPRKSLKYDASGNLLSVILSVRLHEDFIFDSNQKLLGHWIENNCYNEKGELFATRK